MAVLAVEDRGRLESEGMFRRHRRGSSPEANLVSIGTIDCPSGEFVLIDGGYMNIWSGDGSPAEFDHEFDDLCAQRGFRASLQSVERVAHRERVRHTVRSSGAGGFVVHSVPIVAATYERRELPVTECGPTSAAASVSSGRSSQ